MDAAIPADAQNAPTGIWKSRTEREIPTAPPPIIVVVNERKNNGDSNSVAKPSTESDQAQPCSVAPAECHEKGGPNRPTPTGYSCNNAIMRRYERASTLLTSNRPVDDWGKLLGDTAAVTALLDRLLHHAHVLKCGPRSWRTKIHTDLRTEDATK